jgi:conjugative relaxase-like TrwC/TraI family protein
MLRIGFLSAAQLKKYFDEDFSKDSRLEKYYLEESEIVPRWGGRIAQMLNLHGQETLKEDLSNLLSGYLPDGSKFVQRMKEDRRPGFDAVSTCPKSVSIISLFDPRVLQAFRLADEAAMRILEDWGTQTRLRANNQNKDILTSSMIFATIEHQSSRDHDVHLHRHHVIPNITWDGKKYTALTPIAIMERKVLFSSAFDNELARQLRGLGYSIRPTETSFEIEGISRSIVEKFCTGQKKLMVEVELEKERLGVEALSKDEIARLQERTKKKKTKLSPAEFRQKNLSAVTVEEAVHIARLVEAAKPIELPEDEDAAESAVSHGEAHVFERVASAKTFHVGGEALHASLGRCSFAQVKSAMGRRGLVRESLDITTPEHVAAEAEVLEFARAGLTFQEPLALDIQLNPLLSLEQRKMCYTVLQNTSSKISLVLGSPGAGKTFAIKEIAKHAGEGFVMVAPTRKAVKVLQEDGLEANTLESFLRRKELQEGAKTILVDESSLVGTGAMLRLTRAAKENGWRLILVGDPDQNKSVSWGSPFSQLFSKVPELPRAELRENRRQKDPEFRKAVKAFQQNKYAKGVELLDKLGSIKIIPADEARRKAAAVLSCDLLEKGTVSMVGCSWNEIEKTNVEVRAELLKRGKIESEEIVVETLKTISLTIAQKGQEKRWQPSWLVQVVQGTKELAVGTVGQFLGVSRIKGELPAVVFKVEEALHRLPLEAVQAVERKVLKVSAGDRLLLQGNGKSENGIEIIRGTETVEKLENGFIRTKSGKVIDPKKIPMGYGYFKTSQQAQGETADYSVTMAEPGMRKEGFYVGVTRGRLEGYVFSPTKICPQSETVLTATEINERKNTINGTGETQSEGKTSSLVLGGHTASGRIVRKPPQQLRNQGRGRPFRGHGRENANGPSLQIPKDPIRRVPPVERRLGHNL